MGMNRQYQARPGRGYSRLNAPMAMVAGGANGNAAGGYGANGNAAGGGGSAIARDLLAARGAAQNGGMQNGGIPYSAHDEMPETADGTEAIRAEYENSLEYRVGCEIVDALTSAYGLSTEEVEAMLGAGGAPKGVELVSMRAAEVLASLEKEGKLKRSVDEYMEDASFIEMLSKYPAEMAVRLADAEYEAADVKKRAATERERAAEDVVEKLRMRKALPSSIRHGMTANAETDFYSMSPEEFAQFKKKRFGL